jgi:predicted MPP superfamily phosphohydrolase
VVSFVGLDDPHIGRDNLPEPTADTGDLRVGVVHAPYLRALGALRDDGARLILAGHTHGGQVCLPGYGTLVTNCDLDRRRARGLHAWPDGAEDTWLHVSAGLGTSPYAPVRVACRPEATILTLVPA